MLKCETCGKGFRHTATSAGGRPPKHCPAHRRARGAARDVEGTQRRRTERKATKGRAARTQDVALDALRTADLAAALSIFTDPVAAARWVGIAADGAELDRLVALAKAQHQGVIDGEPAALGARLLAAMHLFATAAISQRGQIAPRDLPHVTRAMAQVYAVMIGDKTPRVSELQLVVVGADGVPFDPLAIAQPAARET